MPRSELPKPPIPEGAKPYQAASWLNGTYHARDVAKARMHSENTSPEELSNKKET